MNERTATQAMEAIDKDRMAVHMTVQQIMHIVHDYIPHACRREAEGQLFDIFFTNEVELTSNTMRKEYEAWKKLELNTGMLTPMTKLQP